MREREREGEGEEREKYQKRTINYFRCLISPTTSFFKHALQLKRLIKTFSKKFLFK